MLYRISSLWGLVIVLAVSSTSQAALAADAGSKRVLVILSSARYLDLQKHKKYETGFYLNELAVPAKALVTAGYDLVFTNPKGNIVTWDHHSANALYFNKDLKQEQEAEHFVEHLLTVRHPRSLSSVRKEGVDDYDAVFIPGGHAPMQDLATNPDLGAILSEFHKRHRITALICHGPIALLSTLTSPQSFMESLEGGNLRQARSASRNWIYRGYHMTAFSNAEEKIVETSRLHAQVRVTPATSLRLAGAFLEDAPIWKPNVVTDRELVTGQQPFSDDVFTRTLLLALAQKRKT
ncbi:type 1 glutamine amidotransferase domain-containing protein [Gluconacetobacter diazotrophicus]|uniref:Putative transcriptional regulator n=1 Tax=Gluconacetobacter diazotrophicus (strain ATCC 49037 / DSM 5601 / CCUG 37298 / CIP 103539 / LMG 7603 / PAl5) TaxID=272568 RepID=A9HQ45_GLUDA|nr:type 1 glutamine amidotransferase domain-containing protein [Gluconacetobacter diazotrophicus]CAP56676.1 putative transcriptional regulator [Gluconacetobacter diazotrophicus PA1 5]